MSGNPATIFCLCMRQETLLLTPQVACDFKFLASAACTENMVTHLFRFSAQFLPSFREEEEEAATTKRLLVYKEAIFTRIQLNPKWRRCCFCSQTGAERNAHPLFGGKEVSAAIWGRTDREQRSDKRRARARKTDHGSRSRVHQQQDHRLVLLIPAAPVMERKMTSLLIGTELVSLPSA